MTTPTTVLFVDDDRDFLESKQLYLEARGYRVLTVESPDAAMALLEEETPAIIFLDLMMEHVDDGFRLGYRIGKDERLSHIPLVIRPQHVVGFGDGSPKSCVAAITSDAFLDFS